MTPIIIALWAFLFTHILTGPGEVFSWWPGLIRYLTTGTRAITEPGGFAAGVQKMLFACAKCGAFWWWSLFFVLFETGTKHFVLGAIICVFTAFTIETLWMKLQDRM